MSRRKRKAKAPNKGNKPQKQAKTPFVYTGFRMGVNCRIIVGGKDLTYDNPTDNANTIKWALGMV